MEKIVVTAFYHFFDFANHQAEQPILLRFCQEQSLKGTILVAKEGINSTISGSRLAINNLYQYLSDRFNIKDLIYKESLAGFKPFSKIKVRLKKEIVTMGLPNLNLNSNKATYIEPKDWDAFIADEDVIMVDTRNNYEIELGKFNEALNPNTKNFRDFPKWADENLGNYKNKKIAMYCTGGIRCEKSTSYLNELGFDQVYHLKGGVLQYFADTKNANNKWQGECFVFDDRVTVNVNLDPAYIALCNQCQQKLLPAEQQDYNLGHARFCTDCK